MGQLLGEVGVGYAVRRFEFPEREVPGLSAEDVVDLYEEAIGERTAVLVLPHVDNVVGLRHPIAEIARRARGRGVRWVCVDGAQSVGMHGVTVGELGVDLYATSAHKWLQAPKGSGLMCVSPAMRERLRPLVVTWGHERWRGTARVYSDHGTRDLPRLLALGDALRFHAAVAPAARDAHHRVLFERLRSLAEEHPQLSWRSPRTYDRGAALHAVGIEGVSARELAARLFEEAGFVVRPFEDAGRNHLRVSPNLANDVEELERFLGAVVARQG